MATKKNAQKQSQKAELGFDFEDEIKEKKGYSFQIRLPFIKGVVHACNFKKFYTTNCIHSWWIY